ncbi:hypothetical protein N7528_000688 [Penicillium herquei]|nr:hypothetical protein N7528_000688 [Penicillium herquei]
MGAGGKKSKGKDKSSKAGSKQKNKKSKSPETTEQQTATESSMPGSPDLGVQEQDTTDLGEVSEQPLEQPEQTQLPTPVESSDSPSPEEPPKEEANPNAGIDVTQFLEPDTEELPALSNETTDNTATADTEASGPNEETPTSVEVEEEPLTKEDTEPVAEHLEPIAEPSEPTVEVEQSEPVAESSEQATDHPEAAVEAPEPAAETIEPTVEASESAVETPEPTVETPEPAVEASEPVVETSEPVVETPEPVTETPETVVETTEPAVETPESAVETPETAVEASEAPVEAVEPPVEQSEPLAEQAEPVSEQLDPVVEPTEPVVEQSEAAAVPENAEPVAEREAPEAKTPISTPTRPPSFVSHSPVPSLVPLPSPSFTEARFMQSASPEQHFYHPGPAFVPYGSPHVSPHTSPAGPAYIPYSSPHVSPHTSPAGPAFIPYHSPHASPFGSPYASPIPKVSSPLARSHYPHRPPNMSPTATPPPQIPAAPISPMAIAAPSPQMHPMGPPPPPGPPSTTQSFATAVHSPVMSTSSVVPPYHHPYPHYPPAGHNMQRSYSITDANSPYAATFQAIRDLGLGTGHLSENGNPSPPESEAEHAELLHRIQSAIPDINRLLHGFKNTHSRLSSREAEMKQIGNQHEQALQHKDFYIEALQAQMRKTANESAEECAKLKHTINELRMEVGDLQEKQKDLEDGLATQQKSNDELSQTKSDLEAEVSKLNTTLQDTHNTHTKEREEQKDEHAKALVTQKHELTELFEEIKNEDEKAASDALEAREKELGDLHAAKQGEWETEKTELHESLQTHRTDLDTHKAELATTMAALESKETELQHKLEELTSVRDEVTAKLAELDAKEKELEETRAKSAEDLEALQQGHATEMGALKGTHDEQLAAAAKELAEKIAAIEAHLAEKEEAWSKERAELERQLAEKDSELSSSEREKERLEGDGLVKEQQLQRAVDEMRSTIDHLDGDCDRLRKTLHSLGEATDLKTTKGDQFFLDCFTQLSQLIHDLSKQHFGYLPIDPPKDILSKIPSELPSFLDNTPASRELRCAYVQHVVSKTLTYRVFQPFLFTLGRRYDKADTFFQMLSMDIRRKSVRREAFWRQQTLKAAYTTSDAKQSINVAAAVIVDEIIDHIKHFADPKHLDSLLTGVRKIVKLAAETWRHARVERELVLASFPAPDAESISNDGWEEYGVIPALDASPKGDPARHVVLRTFPSILREAAHEDFASGERASPCIYSQGVLLYSDSPVVMARLQELAKKSTDNLIGDEGASPPKTPHEGLSLRERLSMKERLATMTVQSAPTSPTMRVLR